MSDKSQKPDKPARTKSGGPSLLDTLADSAKPLRKLLDGENTSNEAKNQRERELKAARNAAAKARREAFEARWKDQIDRIRKERDGTQPTSLFAEQEFDGARKRRTMTSGFASSANFQLDLIFSVPEYWEALRSNREQYKYFQDNLGVVFRFLNDADRIGRMTQILGRITKLHAAGQTVLTKTQVDDLAVIIMDAYTRNVGPITDITDEPNALPELWRQIDEKESAAAYFERVISPIPYAMRPTTIELAASQPALHSVLKNLCVNQKRFNRVGDGEIGRARAMSEIFPIGAPKAPQRKPK